MATVTKPEASPPPASLVSADKEYWAKKEEGKGAIKTGAKKTPKKPAPPEQPREYVGLHSWLWHKACSVENTTAKWFACFGAFLLNFGCLFWIDCIIHRLAHHILKSKNCCAPLNPERVKKPPKKPKGSKSEDKADKSDKTDKCDKTEKSLTKGKNRTLREAVEGMPPPPPLKLHSAKKSKKSDEVESPEETPQPTETEEEQAAKMMEEFRKAQEAAALDPANIAKQIATGMVINMLDPTGLAAPAYGLYQMYKMCNQIPDKKLARQEFIKGCVGSGAFAAANYCFPRLMMALTVGVPSLALSYVGYQLYKEGQLGAALGAVFQRVIGRGQPAVETTDEESPSEDVGNVDFSDLRSMVRA